MHICITRFVKWYVSSRTFDYGHFGGTVKQGVVEEHRPTLRDRPNAYLHIVSSSSAVMNVNYNKEAATSGNRALSLSLQFYTQWEFSGYQQLSMRSSRTYQWSWLTLDGRND